MRVRIRLFLCLIVGWVLSISVTFGQSMAQTGIALPNEISSAIDLRANSMRWRTSRNATSFSTAQQAWAQGAFQNSAVQDTARSMTQDAIWYRVDISNPSETNHVLHLVLGANFLVFSEAVVERDGAFDVVFRESNRQPFSARDIKTPRLASRAFEVPPDSETVLWIAIAVDGSSDIALSLMTPEDLLDSHLTLSNLQTAFYTSVLFIALFMLGFLFVYFSWAQFFYLAFFLILAAYNAQLSGLMFQWIWPNGPWWNGYASHYIGLSGIMCAAWAAWLFVSAGHPRPVFRIASLTFQGIGFLAMAAPLFLPLVTVKALLGPVVLIFLIIQFWGAFIALRDRLDGGYIIAAASAVLVVYLGVFTIGSQVEGLIPTFWIVLVLHFGPLLDGVLRFSSSLLQSYRLKQQQVESIRDLAHMKNTLEAVRHDMRQPLGTMRMSLDGVEHGSGQVTLKENLAALRQSFDYLEGVIDQTTPANSKGANKQLMVSAAEVAPVNLYLNCMRRMFTQQASENGIDLRIVPSSAHVLAPPLELTRIMSNLVHNSIQHSKGSKILIGVRSVNSSILNLQIIDNGIGYEMPTKTQKPRGNAKHGHGLHITSDLAKASGVAIAMTSFPDLMNSMTLSIPFASEEMRAQEG